LEDHTDSAARFHRINILAIQVLTVQKDLTCYAAIQYKIIHAIKCPQQRGFSTA
jgi:hypothetical protein